MLADQRDSRAVWWWSRGGAELKGGAARLEGEKITDPNQEFASAMELEGKVLQLGKKTFRRLVG